MNQIFKLKDTLLDIELEPLHDKKDVNFRITYGGHREEKTVISTIISIKDLKEIIQVMQNVVKHCDVPEVNAPIPVYRKDISDRL